MTEPQPRSYKPGEIVNDHFLGDDYQWHPMPPASEQATVAPGPGFGYFYRRQFGRTFLIVFLPLWAILTVVKAGDEVFIAAVIDAALEAAWFGLLLALVANCVAAALAQSRAAPTAAPVATLGRPVATEGVDSATEAVTTDPGSDYSALTRAELEARLAAAEPVEAKSTGVAPSRQPRRRPPRLVIILGAAALVVVALFVADWFERNREMGNLLDAVEASESGMNATNASMRAAVTNAGTAPLNQQQINALQPKLAAYASTGAAAIITTGDAIQDVRILPWHTSLQTAKTRYLAHSNAWEVYLTAAASDPAKLGGPQPEINGTFSSAEAAFRKAVPMFALNNAEHRVDRIFEN